MCESPAEPPATCLKSEPCAAEIPAADLKPLYDYVQDCRAFQDQLAAARQDSADDALKIAAITRERDAAVTAAKGGSFLRRLRRNALWLAIGTAAGLAASKRYSRAPGSAPSGSSRPASPLDPDKPERQFDANRPRGHPVRRLGRLAESSNRLCSAQTPVATPFGSPSARPPDRRHKTAAGLGHLLIPGFRALSPASPPLHSGDARDCLVHVITCSRQVRIFEYLLDMR